MLPEQFLEVAIIKKVEKIYTEITAQQKANADLAGDCSACGKCCNFTQFDHLLFVTPVEIEYLKQHIGHENIKPMKNGICPYNIDGKCTIYHWRFAGCRIFNCRADKDFQSTLTESTLRKLKDLCIEFNMPYRYLELSAALKG